MTHLRYIDSLRGWAFLGVLSVHVAQQFDGFPGKGIALAGQFGVQLFFILSAITLMRSMAIRGDTSPMASFYIRRFFRIAPLYWFGIILYFAYFRFGPRAHAPNGIEVWHIFTNISFVHGWCPTAINAVVPGGWSIGVEMTFYLILPLIAAVAKSPRVTSVLMLVSAAISQLLAWALSPIIHENLLANEQELGEHFLILWFPSQLPVFLLGILVYQLLNNPRVSECIGRPSVSYSLLLSGCSLFALVAGFSEHLDALRSFAVAIPLALIVMSLAGKPIRAMVNPVTQIVGVLSFSSYIFHFAAIKASEMAMSSVHFPLNMDALRVEWRFCMLWIMSLFLTMALAVLGYFIIEKNGIRIGRKLIHIFSRRSSPATVIP